MLTKNHLFFFSFSNIISFSDDNNYFTISKFTS